jgi:hypothetical protein
MKRSARLTGEGEEIGEPHGTIGHRHEVKKRHQLAKRAGIPALTLAFDRVALSRAHFRVPLLP